MDVAPFRNDETGKHEILRGCVDPHFTQVVHCGLIKVELFQKPFDPHLILSA